VTVEAYAFGGKQLFVSKFDAGLITDIELNGFRQLQAGLYFVKVIYNGKYDVLHAVKY
jgi:hypothetical protein